MIYSEGFNEFILFNKTGWLILSWKIVFKVGGIFLVPLIVPSIIISGLWVKSIPFLIFGFWYPFVFPYSIIFFILDVPIILPVILSYILLSFSLFNSIFSWLMLELFFNDSNSFSFKEILLFLSFRTVTDSDLIFCFIPGISPLIISSLIIFPLILLYSSLILSFLMSIIFSFFGISFFSLISIAFVYFSFSFSFNKSNFELISLKSDSLLNFKIIFWVCSFNELFCISLFSIGLIWLLPIFLSFKFWLIFLLGRFLFNFISSSIFPFKIEFNVIGILLFSSCCSRTTISSSTLDLTSFLFSFDFRIPLIIPVITSSLNSFGLDESSILFNSFFSVSL